MRIGIISDTHDLLRPEVVKELDGVERILHIGDVCQPQILEALGRIAGWVHRRVPAACSPVITDVEMLEKKYSHLGVEKAAV